MLQVSPVLNLLGQAAREMKLPWQCGLITKNFCDIGRGMVKAAVQSNKPY
jgi:hypothetical protein